MSAGELDLGRLAELQALLDRDLSEIVGTLLAELTRALGELDGALAGGDLATASRAAHAARNSALMIDAQPLLAGLGELETRARGDDLAGARAAYGAVRERWGRLRRELEGAAAGGGRAGVTGLER